MERRRLIQRLIKKINEGEQLSLHKNYIVTVSKLTGLHSKVLKELVSNDVYEFNIEPVDRSIIYEKLVHFYTKKSKIPCTYELFNSLSGQIPPYIDIENFRKILVKMDFLWKKVSLTHAVVIENPLVRFERYNYLMKIQFYRSINSDIYYLDTGSFDSNGNFTDTRLTKKFVADVLQKDWVQKVIYAVGCNEIHALEEIEDFNCDVVEEWVRDSLLPRIPKPSVFILNINECYNRKLLETPTLDSLKSDTKRWLDRHGVPFDDKMSKYELFALAEKFTDLSKHLFRIDEMLKCYGHSVLRIPKCIANLTSAALLARILDANFSQVVEANGLKNEIDSVSATKKMFTELIKGAGSTYFEEFEKKISSEEAELIETEDSVDHVYDMLMVKAGNTNTTEGNLEDSDLPSCSDSE